jgi:hypothetical protein
VGEKVRKFHQCFLNLLVICQLIHGEIEDSHLEFNILIYIVVVILFTLYFNYQHQLIKLLFKI